MYYETANGDVIIYSPHLEVGTCFNRNDYKNYKPERCVIPSARELAETYPQAKKYLKSKLREEQTWFKGLSDPQRIYTIRCQSSQDNYGYAKEQEVNQVRIEHLQNQIVKSKNEIKRIKNILYFMDHHELLAGDMTQQIAQAKQVPITSLWKFNQMGFAKCFLHEEKQGSLKYYPKSNSWYCFSCLAHGDSIDFVSKLHNLKFLEAVKFLIK